MRLVASKKVDVPLPSPKPWIRSSAEVLAQAREMMADQVDGEADE